MDSTQNLDSPVVTNPVFQTKVRQIAQAMNAAMLSWDPNLEHIKYAHLIGPSMISNSMRIPDEFTTRGDPYGFGYTSAKAATKTGNRFE